MSGAIEVSGCDRNDRHHIGTGLHHLLRGHSLPVAQESECSLPNGLPEIVAGYLGTVATPEPWTDRGPSTH